MSVLLHPVDSVASLLELDRVKPDAFLAGNPQIGWPRLYGGQVVAQALRAAGLTVDAPHRVHSLHAYFVRAGTESEPVLYEVERVRDGRSFTTRAVVAYQAGGAILNLIASFQAEEEGEDRQAIRPPDALGAPADFAAAPTDLFFDHRVVRSVREPVPEQITWMRVPEDLGDDPMVHACALGLPLRRGPARRCGAAALARRPVGLVDVREPRPRHLVPPTGARLRLAGVPARGERRRRRARHGDRPGLRRRGPPRRHGGAGRARPGPQLPLGARSARSLGPRLRR